MRLAASAYEAKRKGVIAWPGGLTQRAQRQMGEGMNAVITALMKGAGQLGDPVVIRLLAKTAALTLLVFAGLGTGLYFGLSAMGDASGVAGGGWLGAAAAVVIAGLAFWFLFRVVALAVLQFFADEIVIAVEQRHYPRAATSARKLPFRRDLANSLRGMGRALLFNALALPVALVLVVTGVGPAIVFLLVNAVLLGRELTDMAWVRHCPEPGDRNRVPGAQRFVLGAIVAGIMLVPFVNFLGAIIGAAAGTHLAHNAMDRRDDKQQESTQ